MLTYILFILGFVFLIKGADYLVIGSSSLAKKLRISDLVIGLTIVAFGTSMPEMIVNIIAGISGKNDLAIGNIVGSNIFNLLFILGLSACIRALLVQGTTVWYEIPLSFAAIIVLWALGNDKLIDGAPQSILSRGDGIIFLIFFFIFLIYTIVISRMQHRKQNKQKKSEDSIKQISPIISVVMIVGGLVGLIVGGNWIVEGAVLVARTFGMSEALIGLTIVGIGTSLPELATSGVAAYRGNVEIAVGNIIGSNIFNVFCILGVGSVVRPILFPEALNVDIIFLMVSTVSLFALIFIGKKGFLEKWQGIMFIVAYIAYLIFLINRG